MNEQTKFVADKLNTPEINTVLNIGYRYDSDTTVQKLLESNNKKFYVLEAWKENCDYLIRTNVCKRVYCGDVREIDTIEQNFDAIIWLHGPEHILFEEFLAIRHKIESKANKLVIYQAPLGEYPQDDLYNNPYERHVQTLYPDMFKELGYQILLQDKERTFSAFIEK